MREEIIVGGRDGRRSAKREGNRKWSGPVGVFDLRISLD